MAPRRTHVLRAKTCELKVAPRRDARPIDGVIGFEEMVYTIGASVPHHGAPDTESPVRSKQRLGRISRQGDHYLRWMLVAGATAVIRHGRKTDFAARPWLADLVECKPTKVAAMALANRITQTAWVLMAKGGTYRQPAMTAP